MKKQNGSLEASEWYYFLSCMDLHRARLVHDIKTGLLKVESFFTRNIPDLQDPECNFWQEGDTFFSECPPNTYVDDCYECVYKIFRENSVIDQLHYDLDYNELAYKIAEKYSY